MNKNTNKLFSLISPLAVIALTTSFETNPFRGDIVYKTDHGEKYIVKKSAVVIRGTRI